MPTGYPIISAGPEFPNKVRLALIQFLTYVRKSPLLTRTAFVAILFSVVSFVIVLIVRSLSEALIVTFIGLVINFTAALCAVLAGLSEIDRRIRSDLLKSELGKVRDFWDVPDPSKEWIILYAGRENFGDRIRYNTVDAILDVFKVIERIHNKRPLLQFIESPNGSPSIALSNTLRHNVIILGGVITVPFVRNLFEELNLPLTQIILFDVNGKKRSEIRETQPGGQGYVAYNTSRENGKVEDNAIIMRIIDKSQKSTLFLFSGNASEGTAAAVLAAVTPELFRSESFNSQDDVNQARVRVVARQSRLSGAHPQISCGHWTGLKIEPIDLGKILEKITQQSGL